MADLRKQAQPLHVVAKLRAGELSPEGNGFRAAGIAATRHQQLPQLLHLKYRVGVADMGDPLVQECRGLILDESADWAPVALPFKAFFNLGEKHAASLDWDTVRVTPKLDGTLMVLYWYGSDDRPESMRSGDSADVGPVQTTCDRAGWQVATSGSPDASTVAEGCEASFHDLFWLTWDKSGHRLPPRHLRHYCFMFELMSPETRVVVPVASPSLTLHGVRDMASLREIEPRLIAGQLGWGHAETIPHLRTKEQVIAAAAEISPVRGEGFVVTDGSFRRLKVKSTRYLLAAHLPRLHWGWQGLSEDVMEAIASDREEVASPHDGFVARLILQGESSEWCAYFPRWAARFHAISRVIDRCAARIESLVECARRRDATPRAVFRGLGRDDPRRHLIMDVFGKGVSVRDALRMLKGRKLLQIIFFQPGADDERGGAPC